LNRRWLLVAAATVVVFAGAAALVLTLRDRDGSAAAVDRCTERMLARVDISRFPGGSRALAARYARRAYCEPFAARGWVHQDGTFALAAYTRSSRSSCARAEPAVTIPCSELEEDPVILDCALLRLVRRSEVRPYVASLRRKAAVRCDDGTPLGRLGA